MSERSSLKEYTNVLVLGASGACGRWVVGLAKERGHHVTAFVRSTASFDAPEGVRVVEGSVLVRIPLKSIT